CLSLRALRRPVRGVAVALALAAVVVPTVLAAGPSAPAAAAGLSAYVPSGQPDAAGTVWLCRPGQAANPCNFPQQATVVPASGPRTVQNGSATTSSKFDCFYVYPTVSTQKSANANLKIQAGEVGAAIAQASRFSSVCQVWAPMYTQRTASSLAQGLGAAPGADAVAYASVLSGWKDYLANYNDGRPIVFIGHSQGSAMLIRLLASQVDPNPALRTRTVLAILPGGNVTVPVGRSVGATFRRLPVCTSSGQAGCVIAYSSFPNQPPRNSLFGRPGQGVSLQSGQKATRGVKVACVNPAAIGGGTAGLDPYFVTPTATPPPPPVATPWVTYPGLYSATCRSGGGASWLQVRTLVRAGRPVMTQSQGAQWGYHADDINLALGNLVDDVKAAESTYAYRG
ncbi:MAG TPA: DUF3089 domain-containing protein, partial [Acidimicrobiales bacterium]|nr:DUF3089 domain-containing protein [Acidimicrobiales bacterium]